MSNHAKALLCELQIAQNLGPGLESVGKTRFATLLWSAVSIQRSLPAIRELCTSEAVTIPVCPYQFEIRF